MTLGRALDALVDPSLDRLLAAPSRVGVTSAWYGHVPFAGWIVKALRPGLLVELGTHAGVSYCAFCDGVLREGLPTRCVAVDTWRGDEHASFYDENVFADLKTFHDERYAGFSELRAATFDAALDDFADGTIDLLHIDGRHFYTDVRHDYDTWRPKLSQRAVVLFHDTQVRERGFGVWRLWSELAGAAPHFEFVHAYGLGVLAIGPDIAPDIVALCAATGTSAEGVIRDRFAALGQRWEYGYEKHLAEVAKTYLEGFQSEVEGAVAREARALAVAAEIRSEYETTVEVFRRVYDDREALIRARDVLVRQVAALRARAAASEVARDAAAAQSREADETLRSAESLLDATVRSRGWVTLTKLRRIAGFAPSPRLDDFPLARAAPPAPVPSKTTARRIVYASGEPDTPGHRYRVERYAEAARAIGWDAQAMSVRELSEEALASADVVVFWRAAWSGALDYAYFLARRAGAVVAFDIDDLMVRPDLARIEVIDGIRSQNLVEAVIAELYGAMWRSMEAADVCFCPTHALAAQARALGKAAFVLPNGFDDSVWRASRRAACLRAASAEDVVRIGYAAGTRTHQRDLAVAVPALLRILDTYPACRLVLFHAEANALIAGPPVPLVDVAELGLDRVAHQIEWRCAVSLEALPAEMARFDINIAPLEVGNPYCEAKSELKYVEAALVGVPTVASPTDPFQRAITNQETGLLARDSDEWLSALERLVVDTELRRRLGWSACMDALRRFGPRARSAGLRSALARIEEGRFGADDVSDLVSAPAPPSPPGATLLFSSDSNADANVTAIVAISNNDEDLRHLDAALALTFAPLDIIVVDDATFAEMGDAALELIRSNAVRFNRVRLLRHRTEGVADAALDSAVFMVESPFVIVCSKAEPPIRVTVDAPEHEMMTVEAWAANGGVSRMRAG